MRTVNEQKLRSFISKEVKILVEKRGDEESKEKGRKAFAGYKDAAKVIQKDLDVSKGPADVRAFLNGPGADPKVRAVLAGGQTDGDPNDEKASPQETSVTIGSLSPTQNEIELSKSIAFPFSVFAFLKKMCGGGAKRVGPKGNDQIVISGNLIVDGHHRWSSLFSVTGPEGQIAAIDLGIPEKDAASVLATTQVAIASTLRGGEEVPSAKAGASNILGLGKDEIKSLVESAVETGAGEKGPMMTDKFMQQCLDDSTVSEHFGISGMDIEKARETMIEKIADNLSKMNQPAPGSPERTEMPQIDAAQGGVKGVIKALDQGKVNYKEPFSPGVKPEGHTQNDTIMVERWQKLAGLIK